MTIVRRTLVFVAAGAGAGALTGIVHAAVIAINSWLSWDVPNMPGVSAAESLSMLGLAGAIGLVLGTLTGLFAAVIDLGLRRVIRNAAWRGVVIGVAVLAALVVYLGATADFSFDIEPFWFPALGFAGVAAGISVWWLDRRLP